MGTTLAAANAAFQLSSSVLQQLGKTPAEGSEKSHSLCDYWPVVAAGLSCLISTINAIALSLIGNIVVAALLAISALGTGILTLYLWSFSSLKSLEGYVEAFAERVTTLAQTALQLSDVNKELTSTRIAIENELNHNTEKSNEEKQEVATLVHRLDDVSHALQQSQHQVAQMGHIFNGSNTLITEITSKISDFVSLNKKVSTSSQVLATELTSIKSIADQVGSAVSALHENNDMIEEKQRQAEETARGICTQFMQVAELLVECKKQREGVEKVLQNLQKTDNSIAIHTKELNSAAENLSKGASDAQTFVDSLKPYAGLAKAIKARMANPPEPSQGK